MTNEIGLDEYINEVLENEINWESAFEDRGELLKHDKNNDIYYFEFLPLGQGKLVLADDENGYHEGDKTYKVMYVSNGTWNFAKIKVELGAININGGFMVDEDLYENSLLDLEDDELDILNSEMDYIIGDN